MAECIGYSQTEVISVKLVPELQHWFRHFVDRSIVNKNEVPASVDVDAKWMPPKSFVEMLFNESYPYDSYEYLYTETPQNVDNGSATNVVCCGDPAAGDPAAGVGLPNAGWPPLVRTRLMIYGAAARYLYLGATGDNVFLLQQDDFTLLDALLAYRQDSTSVTIIDSTALTVFDSTSGVLVACYDCMATSLSKLIYLYLKLKIYGDISRYNNLIIVSRTGTNPSYIVLENMFELFLIDAYFDTVSNRYVRNVGGCT